MKCSIINCPNPPIAECYCSNSKKYFCEQDITSHIFEGNSVEHKTKKIINVSGNKVNDLISQKLEELKKKISDSRNLLIEDFSRMVSMLEGRLKIVLGKMNQYERDLCSFINNLSDISAGPADCTLRSVLKSSLNEATAEISSWESIYNFTLNNTGLSDAIKSYASIEEDFEYIFTNKKRKQENTNFNVAYVPSRSQIRPNTTYSMT